MKAPSKRQVVFWAALAVGCGGAAAKKATADIQPTTSQSTVTGTATFTQNGDDVTVKLDIAGATEGMRAAHIHANGDCSAEGNGAGGHWNPATQNHGAWENTPHHLGDIGNIEVGADGTGTVSITTSAWTLGDGDAGTDVVGHAIIIHSGTDDFVTQPTGDAGSRLGCGVIVQQND